MSERLENTRIVVYEGNVGYLIRDLIDTQIFLSCYCPRVFDYLSKDIENNISYSIERDNVVIDTVHYHRKDLFDNNYFRISRKNDSVELYFPYQITDDEILKLIPNMEIYDVESYRSSNYLMTTILLLIQSSYHVSIQ